TAGPEEKVAAGRVAEAPEARPEPAGKPAQEAKVVSPAPGAALPKMEYEEDDDVDPTKVASKASVSEDHRAVPIPTKRIVYDEDAESDPPTQPHALILVSASAQTDKGLRRKRNEDNLLVMPDEGLFVVADGMGGYR